VALLDLKVLNIQAPLDSRECPDLRDIPEGMDLDPTVEGCAVAAFTNHNGLRLFITTCSGLRI